MSADNVVLSARCYADLMKERDEAFERIERLEAAARTFLHSQTAANALELQEVLKDGQSENGE